VFLLSLSDLALSSHQQHPLSASPIFNPSPSQFASQSFYSSPTIHPFTTQEELEREARRDPFGGFNTRQFRASHNELRTLQAEFQHTRSPHVSRLMNDLFDSQDSRNRIQRSISHTFPKEDGGQHVELSYDVNLVNGLVSLDAEQNVHIQSIQCTAENGKLRLQLMNAESLNEVKRWIPGTRFVIGAQWGCHFDDDEHASSFAEMQHLETDSEEQLHRPHYRLLVRRHWVSSTVIEFDTAPLTQQDCFTRSTVDFHYKPNEDLLREQLETQAGAFKDTSALGAHQSDVPAFEAMWRLSERHQSKNKRYFVDKTQNFDLLNFNYNRNSGRAEKPFDFFSEYKSGGLSAKATCVNCYAYIGFEVRFRMDTTFVWINELIASVSGGAKFAFETLIDIQYSYNKVFEKKDIISKALSQIQFAVGPIPVIIHPSVKLDAKLQVDVAAKLQITHSATYTDTIALGIKYQNKKLTRIQDRSYPDLRIGSPKISDDSEATLDAKFTLIPRVRLNFYAVSPLDLTVLPYIRLNARVGNAACGRAGASYNTYWGMQMAIQQQKLAVPKTVYGIGGKQFDLGGVLPFPKYVSDATFTVVSDRALTCSYCSGCINLAKFWSKRSVREVVPSFLEASAVDTHVLASAVGGASAEESTDPPANTVSILELGKSVRDREIPAAGQCHVYKTSELDAAVAPNDVFGTGIMDTRQVQVAVEIFAADGTSQTLPLKMYWNQDEQPVMDKSTTISKLVDRSFLASEKWQHMVFSLCNEHASTSEQTRYSLQTRAAAEIGRFHIATPTLTVKKNSILRLMIREVKTAQSVVDRIVFTNKQMTGDADIAVTVYAEDIERQLFKMDKRFLVLEARKPVEDMELSVDSNNYPHSTHDYVIVADIFGREEHDESTFQVQANGMFHSHLRKVETIGSNMNFLQIQRSHVSYEDIWKYVISVKRSTSVGSEQFCAFTGQLSVMDLDVSEQTCFTIPDGQSEAYFAYHIPKEAIEFGLDYFMIEIKGDYQSEFSHTITEISVDEHRFIRSGELMAFNLRGPSQGGDRFILYRDNMDDSLQADKLLVQGRTYIRDGIPCVAGGCYVDVRIALVETHDNAADVEKWTHSIQSDMDGYIKYEMSFDDLKASLAPEDAAKIKYFKVVVDVTSNDDATTNKYHLEVDEMSVVSPQKTVFTDQISFKSRTTEMMFYHIPHSVIEHFGGACIVDVKAVPSEQSPHTEARDAISTSDVMPHVYVQKGSLPRFSSFLMTGQQSPGQARVGFYADSASSSYYVAVTTQSEELNYELTVSSLPVASVDITYSTPSKSGSNGQPRFSIDDMKAEGFIIKFALSSDDHAWSPKLTDPLPSTTCKKLLALFKPNDAFDQWKLLQDHMLNTLIDAFNPDSPTDPKTFIDYSEKIVTLTFPPFEVGTVRLLHDLIVNVDSNLDPDLFTTQDSRISVREGQKFYIEKNSFDWLYIILPIAFAVVFLILLAAGASTVGCIVYKAVVQSKNRSLKDKLVVRRKAKNELKEEFLDGEEGSLEMDDVMVPEPAIV